MKDRLPSALIRNEEIIGNAPTTITSLDSLRQFLETRGTLFFNRLAVVTQIDKGLGRQTLSFHKGVLNKTRTSREQNRIFTGSLLCSFASYALLDGLANKVKEIDLNIAELTTDITAEEWTNPNYKLRELNHDIVCATETETGNALYFDPTYRQVDHRFSGTILCFEEGEIQQYYKSKKEVVVKKVIGPLLSGEAVARAYYLPTNSYNSLVASLD